jgi:hypothetical protein
MASRINHKIPVAAVPYVTEQGLDLSLFPIDSVLRQALSPNEELFRTGCTLLSSMSRAGRVEAGVFLLGLLGQYPENYARLTLIAEALWSFPVKATVDALASELRRVKGSSSTRGYLRQIIATLERFPAQLVEETIQVLSVDPQVGTRFRQHLRSMMLRQVDEWPHSALYLPSEGP